MGVYILIDDQGVFVNAYYDTLCAAMEASTDFIAQGLSTKHVILESTVLGTVQDLPWGGLVWEDA